MEEVCPKECIHTRNHCSQRKFKKQSEELIRPAVGWKRSTKVPLISESLSEHIVFPTLLQRSHVFTSLVLKSFQETLMHAVVSNTLAAIRREVWIPQGRSAVRRVLLNCLRCRRHQGGPYRMPAIIHDQESKNLRPLPTPVLTILDPCIWKSVSCQQPKKSSCVCLLV